MLNMPSVDNIVNNGDEGNRSGCVFLLITTAVRKIAKYELSTVRKSTNSFLVGWRATEVWSR